MSEIVLVRHAQSEANVAGAWQGRGNAKLSAAGRSQVAALAARFAGRAFDLVVSSPLERAIETAVAFSDEPETHPDLIEIDLGRWEGVSFDVVATTDRDRLRAIYNGSDEAFGSSGERMSEVAARAWSVIDSVADRVGPEGRVAIVTHGGVIDSLFGTLVPTIDRRPHRMAANASLTHLVGTAGDWSLARFNDTTHMAPLPSFAAAQVESGGSVLALIRHGRTRANLEARFQGQSCWGLDEMGERQASLYAGWYGPYDRVFSSPLERAEATAVALSPRPPVLVDGLMEIGLGTWEGLSRDEVHRGWPDLVRRIYELGEDLPRGETGETWAQATARMVTAIDGLETSPGVTAVVSHGGVMRGYVGTLGGDTTSTRSRFANPTNTSVTHIAVTKDGPVLCDYAVAPHLESLEVVS